MVNGVNSLEASYLKANPGQAVVLVNFSTSLEASYLNASPGQVVVVALTKHCAGSSSQYASSFCSSKTSG